MLDFLTAKRLERLMLGARSTLFGSVVIKMFKKVDNKYYNCINKSSWEITTISFTVTHSLIFVKWLRTAIEKETIYKHYSNNVQLSLFINRNYNNFKKAVFQYEQTTLQQQLSIE